MDIWIVIWQVCLIAALFGFAVFAVAVTLEGAADIRKLLRRLRDEEEH